MVDVPVNRSDKLQQSTFVVGVSVQKTAEFSQAQVGGTLRAQRLVPVDTCSASVLGAFKRAITFST